MGRGGHNFQRNKFDSCFLRREKAEIKGLYVNALVQVLRKIITDLAFYACDSHLKTKVCQRNCQIKSGKICSQNTRTNSNAQRSLSQEGSDPGWGFEWGRDKCPGQTGRTRNASDNQTKRESGHGMGVSGAMIRLFSSLQSTLFIYLVCVCCMHVCWYCVQVCTPMHSHAEVREWLCVSSSIAVFLIPRTGSPWTENLPFSG